VKLDPEFRGDGKTRDQILWEQQVRQRRIEARGLRVARWDWDAALDGGRMQRAITTLGVPALGEPWVTADDLAQLLGVAQVALPYRRTRGERRRGVRWLL